MGFSLLICKKGLSIVVWLAFWDNCSTHTKAPPLILPGPKSVSVGLNLNKAIAGYKGLMCKVGYLNVCVWLLLPCRYFSNPNTATLGNSPSSFMMNILYGCLYNETSGHHWGIGQPAIQLPGAEFLCDRGIHVWCEFCFQPSDQGRVSKEHAVRHETP